MVSIQLPDNVRPLLTSQARYKILWGGRGSGKSESIARILVIRSMEKPLRILCARQYQANINESVHSMLAKVIREYNLEAYFTIQERTIKNIYGSEFLFCGLNDDSIAGIKSMNSPTHVWIEEAASITNPTWAKLDPTIRAEGSEIWCSLNREMDNDPISKLFITNSNPPKNSIVINMNYEDNPWFPQVLRDQMEEMKANDYEQYLHVWRGEPLTHSQAAIYKGKIISKPFTPDEDLWSPLYGADLGFARDPSVLVKCWVYEDRLYIEHEWYQIGVEQDLLPAYYDSIPGARDHTIYVDGGGLGIGSVSYLKRNGYPRVQAVPKWKGSVNDGIERMRAFNKIVIHPRCVHALEDFSKYSYKVDKVTGLVLPDPLHDHSDVCDSCRYAIFPLIKGVKLKGMTNTALPDRPEQKLDSMGNPVGRSYGVDKNAWMC